MRSRVCRWGNSLALRIPKSVAAEACLSDQSVVDIKVVGGKLVVASVAETEITLEKLLSDVNEHNLHGEASADPSSETDNEHP